MSNKSFKEHQHWADKQKKQASVWPGGVDPKTIIILGDDGVERTLYSIIEAKRMQRKNRKRGYNEQK